MRSLISFFFILNLFFYTSAQQQSCQGIKGERIFYENFGEGEGVGAALSPSIISYEYTLNFPEEEQYTIRSNTLPDSETLPDPNSWLWHIIPNDVSSNLGSEPGKMLLINATNNEGVYYENTVENLCEFTNYEFSFWLASLYNISSGLCTENQGDGIHANVRFEVWNQDETELLAFAETGDIANTSTIDFQRYALLFTTLENQTEAHIKIINNTLTSGCGNDIAIDEIQVQLCGSLSELYSVEYDTVEPTFCVDDPSRNITLQLDNFESIGFFMWQQSTDGINWENLDDIIYPTTEGNLFFETPEIFSTTYYRVIFAATEDNLLNAEVSCTWSTETYKVNIISSTDSPEPFLSEFTYCGDSDIPALAVIPTSDLTVNWYDSAIGGNLLLENSFNFVPPGPGTYYAGYASEEFTCVGDYRTPITLNWYPGIMVSTNPDPIMVCGDEGVILDAIHPDSIYQWDPSTLGNGQTAVVYEPGLYVVTIRDPNSFCDEARTRTFIVEGYINPEIADISHDGSNLIVTMTHEDEYEYSLDGNNWQPSNIFYNIGSGLFTVYVRDIIDCGSDYQEYFLLKFPKFFTPNGDGYNDTLKIDYIDELNLEVWIFDRYGKLISILDSNVNEWDGTYKGEKLTGSDYWYRIFKDGVLYSQGHFTLKR